MAYCWLAGIVCSFRVNAKFHYAIWFEAGSILVADRFESGRNLVADLLACASSLLASYDRPNFSSLQVCDQLRTSFEPASNQLAQRNLAFRSEFLSPPGIALVVFAPNTLPTPLILLPFTVLFALSATWLIQNARGYRQYDYLALNTVSVSASISSGDLLKCSTSGPRKTIANGTGQSARQLLTLL